MKCLIRGLNWLLKEVDNEVGNRTAEGREERRRKEEERRIGEFVLFAIFVSDLLLLL